MQTITWSILNPKLLNIDDALEGSDWVLFGSRPDRHKFIVVEADREGSVPCGIVAGYSTREEALQKGLQHDEVSHITLEYLGKSGNLHCYKEIRGLTYECGGFTELKVDELRVAIHQFVRPVWKSEMKPAENFVGEVQPTAHPDYFWTVATGGVTQYLYGHKNTSGELEWGVYWHGSHNESFFRVLESDNPRMYREVFLLAAGFGLDATVEDDARKILHLAFKYMVREYGKRSRFLETFAKQGWADEPEFAQYFE